jgi:hypothetical protein
MQARPFNNRGGFVVDKFPDKERRWLNHVLTHMSTKGGHMKPGDRWVVSALLPALLLKRTANPSRRSAIARAFKAGRDSGVENDPLAQAEAALQVPSSRDPLRLPPSPPHTHSS